MKRGNTSIRTITYLDEAGNERAAWTSKPGTDDALLSDYLEELGGQDEGWNKTALTPSAGLSIPSRPKSKSDA